MTMTRIAIIGPGAMGCFFASKCFQAGMEVLLIDYNARRAAFLEEQGIFVEYGCSSEVSWPHVSTTFPSALDLIVVLTKAYSTPKLHIPPSAPILTLQNGLGNAEILANNYGSNRVLAGTTSEAVTWLSPGRVRHVAGGNTVIGSWNKCDVTQALSYLQDAGLNAIETTIPRSALWEKVIVNAAINPLTALLNVKNGFLLDKPDSRDFMRDLVTEALSVATVEGFHFSRDMVEITEQICSTTCENISSMLQDIRNGKKTEIESISGEIYRRAVSHGLFAPKTHAVYQLVRLLERR
jgi:2-dehydropantoate 2-reductase